MDCRTAREWMATAVAGGVDPAQDVRAHLSQCPGCRDEFQGFKRTWDLLGAWSETEPPTHLDRAILAEVGAETERSRSWLRRLASVRVWATATLAAALAVTASLLVPYQDSLRICGKVLADAGLALPALPLSFLIGFAYAFLPLLMVVLAWMALKGKGPMVRWPVVGQVFAFVIVPYIVFACADLEPRVVVGILMGTVTGALLGGGMSQWLAGRRPAHAAA